AVLEGFPNILLEDHQIGLLGAAVMPHERFFKVTSMGGHFGGQLYCFCRDDNIMPSIKSIYFSFLNELK
ncbi:hypothetical protein, partial [Oscillibacter sp. KLE 1745]|uniref:hypothetical protein n=1 Tax=Oscillibacter sp. KLE 1745 TaxID=1226323 RepID=UPI001A9A3401